MLAINFPLKVIQSFIIYINTYKHKMIEIGKENEKIKNKGKWYYCHHMRIFPFWGDNHRLPLLHMDKLEFVLKKQKNVLMSLRLDI